MQGVKLRRPELFEAARLVGCNRVAYASSLAVYVMIPKIERPGNVAVGIRLAGPGMACSGRSRAARVASLSQRRLGRTLIRSDARGLPVALPGR
jgi:hypothetical protein